MARELHRFAVTVPAGTPQAAPLVASLAMPEREVRAIELDVPPGPRGQLGLRIGMAGVSIVPINPGQWLVPDNAHHRWELEGLPSSGAWQLQGYNTGAFDHTVEVRFLVDLPAGQAGLNPPPPPVTLSASTAAPAPVQPSMSQVPLSDLGLGLTPPPGLG